MAAYKDLDGKDGRSNRFCRIRRIGRRTKSATIGLKP